MIRMAQDEWISIGDEMPQFHDEVLLFVFDNSLPELKYACCGLLDPREGWLIWSEDEDEVTVTHWMPLPSPPRDDE